MNMLEAIYKANDASEAVSQDMVPSFHHIRILNYETKLAFKGIKN